MSAALETLPPDQRAVLQLILKQGRGYAELSSLLKIDEAAVRARAHAGLDALVGNGAGAALTPERRGQIADYLLGQQTDADRATTLQHLEDSRAARRWAGALHDRLSPLAGRELPEIPGLAARPATEPPAPPADAPAQPADAPAQPADAPASEPAAPADAPARTAPAPAPRRERPQRDPRSSSKLGGILLLVGVAVLVAVVLVIVLGGGDDDDGGSATTPAAQTQAQRRGGRAPDDTTVLQQVNLNAPDGGDRPVGVAFLMVQDQRPVVAVQVQDIAPNGQGDIYAAWLRSGRSGRSKFLGYVPDLVGRDGRFTVSSNLPRDTVRYDEVVVSRESVANRAPPPSPTDVVLSGTIRINRTG